MDFRLLALRQIAGDTDGDQRLDALLLDFSKDFSTQFFQHSGRGIALAGFEKSGQFPQFVQLLARQNIVGKQTLDGSALFQSDIAAQVGAQQLRSLVCFRRHRQIPANFLITCATSLLFDY